MDRPVVQALNGLLPSLNGTLSPELLELAVALLAQSRSKASTLKAEEEIARSYACAHIACERLRKPLSLPKIQPRPPCPPRAYQKLYRYLDTALPTAVKRSERAPKPKIAQTTPTKISSTRTTPARAKAKPPESLTHIKTIPRASRTRAELPEWTMPVIRRFCSALKAPTSVPHVFAGVSSILTLQPSIPSASLKEDKIPALIVAVFLFVETRLLGRDLNKDDLTREKAHALQILKSVDLFKDSREIVGIGDINDWVEEIEEKNWTSLDWFSNVGQERNLVATISSNEGSMDLDGDSRERIVPVQKAQTAEASTKTLEAGIGTMMQDRVDYLSEDRRLDFLDWKAGILAKVEELEHNDLVDTS